MYRARTEREESLKMQLIERVGRTKQVRTLPECTRRNGVLQCDEPRTLKFEGYSQKVHRRNYRAATGNPYFVALIKSS